MADDQIFDTESVDALFPDDEAILDPAEELAQSDAALEADLGDDNLEVSFEEPQPPLGRGFAWDFRTGMANAGGHGPREIRGQNSLRTWIEKCLLTEAGAHPIHPDGYGLRKALNDWLGGPAQVPSQGELGEEIRSAMLFHPSITDMKNFKISVTETEGDAFAEIAFSVVTDQGDARIAVQIATTGEVLG